MTSGQGIVTVKRRKMNQNKPIVTIVATAHNEFPSNRPFIDSMLNQTERVSEGRWKMIVWHNGPWGHHDHHTWKFTQDGFTHQPEYKYSETDTGDWGARNRQQAIDECDTEYIIQTSIQDYWLPQAMEYIIRELQKSSPDILVWNSINHLVGPCQVLDSQLVWSKLDWGNFAIRTDIARQVRIMPEQYCADWYFIKALIDKGLIKNVRKLNGTLTIHN